MDVAAVLAAEPAAPVAGDFASWYSVVNKDPALVVIVTIVIAAVVIFRAIIQPSRKLEDERETAQQSLTQQMIAASLEAARFADLASKNAKECSQYAYNTARVMQQVLRDAGWKVRPSEELHSPGTNGFAAGDEFVPAVKARAGGHGAGGQVGGTQGE